jgi:ABC-type multidrug transport system ATPase subunit
MPSTASSIIAALEGATKAYGSHRVLDGFDFALEAGSVTALLGPNGAGKSTVAGLLTGRSRADAGTVNLIPPISWPGRVWGSCFRRAACPRR